MFKEFLRLIDDLNANGGLVQSTRDDNKPHHQPGESNGYQSWGPVLQLLYSMASGMESRRGQKFPIRACSHFNPVYARHQNTVLHDHNQKAAIHALCSIRALLSLRALLSFRALLPCRALFARLFMDCMHQLLREAVEPKRLLTLENKTQNAQLFSSD